MSAFRVTGEISTLSQTVLTFPHFTFTALNSLYLSTAGSFNSVFVCLWRNVWGFPLGDWIWIIWIMNRYFFSSYCFSVFLYTKIVFYQCKTVLLKQERQSDEDAKQLLQLKYSWLWVQLQWFSRVISIACIYLT